MPIKPKQKISYRRKHRQLAELLAAAVRDAKVRQAF